MIKNMNNKFQFNASEVTCNGNIGGCAVVLTAENKSILSTFLKTHFMMAPQQVILQELEDSDMISADWIIGRRAGDIDEIINRMVSGLVCYALDKFQSDGGTYKAHRELADMWVNAQVKMMSAKDIITIMEKALADCAEADHWYTYEKEWC